MPKSTTLSDPERPNARHYALFHTMLPQIHWSYTQYRQSSLGNMWFMGNDARYLCGSWDYYKCQRCFWSILWFSIVFTYEWIVCFGGIIGNNALQYRASRIRGECRLSTDEKREIRDRDRLGWLRDSPQWNARQILLCAYLLSARLLGPRQRFRLAASHFAGFIYGRDFDASSFTQQVSSSLHC